MGKVYLMRNRLYAVNNNGVERRFSKENEEEAYIFAGIPREVWADEEPEVELEALEEEVQVATIPKSLFPFRRG